jgi:hypothetical protein
MIRFCLKHITAIVVFAVLAWNFVLLGVIYIMWTSELREMVKQSAFSTDLAEANRVVMTVFLGILWFWSMYHILNAVQMAILIKKNLKK